MVRAAALTGDPQYSRILRADGGRRWLDAMSYLSKQRHDWTRYPPEPTGGRLGSRQCRQIGLSSWPRSTDEFRWDKCVA